LAHPGGLQCGDARFDVGSTTKCMTLEIVDKQIHPGLIFEADTKKYIPGADVHFTLDVESPGAYDNSTGQDPYGIYFAILAKAPTSIDYGSFTAVPDTVSPKDSSICPHQVFSGSDDTTKDTVAMTWTAGPQTCGDVTFTMLWGNGPGDAPKAPSDPFMHRSVITISGEPCKDPQTTTPAVPVGETWQCTICAHVYDADLDGAGLAFEDLPNDWICPVCAQPKSSYQKQVDVALPAADTWTCTICAHVYDADADGAGLAFEDLPNDWICPVCAQPKSSYQKQVDVASPAADTWTCTICAHVYDADADGAGLAFEDLPNDWICPVCAQPKSSYQKEVDIALPAADSWTCTICAHVYDADLDGAGLAFEDLPNDWLCPVCAQPKSSYEKQAYQKQTNDFFI